MHHAITLIPALMLATGVAATPVSAATAAHAQEAIVLTTQAGLCLTVDYIGTDATNPVITARCGAANQSFTRRRVEEAEGDVYRITNPEGTYCLEAVAVEGSEGGQYVMASCDASNTKQDIRFMWKNRSVTQLSAGSTRWCATVNGHPWELSLPLFDTRCNAADDAQLFTVRF